MDFCERLIKKKRVKEDLVCFFFQIVKKANDIINIVYLDHCFWPFKPLLLSTHLLAFIWVLIVIHYLEEKDCAKFVIKSTHTHGHKSSSPIEKQDTFRKVTSEQVNKISNVILQEV